jgi:O-antigen ligase
MSWSDSTVYSEEAFDPYAAPAVPLETPKQSGGIVAWAAGGAVVITALYAHQFGTNWIPQAASLGVVALWLIVDVILRRQPIRLYPPFVLWLVWLVWESIGNLVGGDLPTEVLVFGTFSTLKVFVFCAIVSNVVRRWENWVPLYIVLMVFPAVVVLLFQDYVAELTYEVQRGLQRGVTRFGAEEAGGFGDANALSMFGSLCLISGIGLFLLWKGRVWRWLALGTVGSTLMFLGYLGSRTGMAMVLLLAVAFWFVYLRSEAKGRPELQLAGVVAMVVMVVGAFIWVVTSPFAYRFAGSVDEYTGARSNLAITAVKATAASPILGHGMFGFRMRAHEFGGTPNMAVHNTYAEVLVRGGIPGFLLYYAAWFLVMRQLWRLRTLAPARQDRIVANMCLLMCIAFHGFSMTLTLLVNRMTFPVLGACIGYAYGLTEKLKTTQPQP